jgi:hypothetical protein
VPVKQHYRAWSKPRCHGANASVVRTHHHEALPFAAVTDSLRPQSIQEPFAELERIEHLAGGILGVLISGVVQRDRTAECGGAEGTHSEVML